jgi:hypothetical protein
MGFGFERLAWPWFHMGMVQLSYLWQLLLAIK